MAKETKELTVKQKIRRNKALQIACKIGEYLVLPIPFAALMIVNRDAWFGTTTSAIGMSVGGVSTIGILVAQIVIVIRESEEKSVPKGYVVTLLKWIMVCIIITCVEQFLHTIAGVMWIATSGIAASFGLDLARLGFKKKSQTYQTAYDNANLEIEQSQAKEEITQEQQQGKRKIKVKIKK